MSKPPRHRRAPAASPNKGGSPNKGTPRGAGRKGTSRRGGGPGGRQDARKEMEQVAGPVAAREYRRLLDAAEHFENERYRDARRTLTALRRRYPDALAVLELFGLTLYRQGDYARARDELERFRALSGTTEQHPVLMDCYRAQGALAEVEELWRELRDASPAGALVVEGRIVMANALAEAGRLEEGLRLLDKGPTEPKRAKPHHLRLWYALADLEERAGNLPRARSLFEQIRRRDASFADVAERVAGLG